MKADSARVCLQHALGNKPMQRRIKLRKTSCDQKLIPSQLAACKTLASMEREGYGGPCDVTSLSLS